MKETRNIIITGGLGFIGGNYIRHIISDKNLNILNIDLETYAANTELKNEFKNYDNYKFINEDISSTKMKNIIKDFSPNLIINFAAETHVDRSIEQPDIFLESNVRGTVNILNSLLTYKDVANVKFIHISTDEVFGDAKEGEFFNEDSNIKTSSPYSASKASAELFVSAYRKTYGLNCIDVNITNNYGPFQTPEKLIPRSILRAINGLEIEIYGNGQNERDWLWVGDTVKAIDLISKNELEHKKYCIGMGNSVKNIDIINLITKILDEEFAHLKPNKVDSFKSLIKFVDDRPGHDLAYRVDSSRLKNELAWKPCETLKSGLKKTIDFYINNQNYLRDNNFRKRLGNL